MQPQGAIATAHSEGATPRLAARIGRATDLTGLAHRLLACAVVMAVLVACAPSTAPGTSGSGASQPPAAPSGRTLVVAIRVEPPTITTRPLQTAGIGLYLPSRMFNASIGLLDGDGKVRPYLVDALPQLNSDNWQLSPDGTMTTTYRFKPNVVWQDGAALDADDFVFAWNVYSTKEFGQSGASPFRSIRDVVAQDSRTLVIHWKEPYPDVSFTDGLNTEFPPLPRHILEDSFRSGAMDAFVADPFWTREYVGLGPYRLTQWEPGAYIEAEAFDRHILGKPKIGKIRLDFSSDERAVLSRILAGEVLMTDGTSMGLPEVQVLKQDWIPQGKGNVVIHPNQWRAVHFQNRADIAQPQALLNRTVRKALAHTVDKNALNDALYYGLATPTDSLVAPQSIWGPAAEKGAVKYPYDLKQTDQLMQQAGFRKGPDGVYASPTDGRLSWLTETNAGSDNESEMSILAAGWRQAGFDVQENVLSASEARNPEKRATFPATFSNSQNCCGSALLGFTSANIGTQDTRWAGANRSGWSNADFDRLASAFAQTLDFQEREAQVTSMVHVMTDDMQSISLLIRGQPWVYVSELKGIAIAPPEGNISWNIHEWELR
ncbi:MAG TPA: ABC transporter substrate-binding protein [Chloroflexota bacterium]|nr:ABC transporter substrate-binding protein [Chloroflexota bacterium]